MVMISVNFIPTDREAQLYPQALGVHLFAFYEPYELMVGLFLPGHHAGEQINMNIHKNFIHCSTEFSYILYIIRHITGLKVHDNRIKKDQ